MKKTQVAMLIMNCVSLALALVGCKLAYKRGYKAAQSEYQRYVDYFDKKSSEMKVDKDEFVGKTNKR